MPAAIEQRSYRAPVSVLVQVRRGRRVCEAMVVNISAGGAFLAISPPLPIGSGVAFRITVAGEVLELRGYVRWTRSLPAGPEWPVGSGVEIFDPDGSVAVSLGAAIHRLREGG